MTDAHVKKPDVPDVLYRGFKVLEHARAFVDEGIIRFGRLDMYRNLEDPRRRDPDEGIARLRMPMTDSQDLADVIPTECKGRNWTYVLCCSAADQGYVASKFGRYVVRINNPGELIVDIRGAIFRPIHWYPTRALIQDGSPTTAAPPPRDRWTLTNCLPSHIHRNRLRLWTTKNFESRFLACSRTRVQPRIRSGHGHSFSSS